MKTKIITIIFTIIPFLSHSKEIMLYDPLCNRLQAVASTSYNSIYSFRGIPSSKGSSQFFSVSTIYDNFTANIWTAKEIDTWETIETDLSMMLNFGKLDLIYVNYNTGDLNTNEAGLSLNFEVPLSPVFSAMYDFDKGDGAYLSLSGHQEYNISRNISLYLFALLGFNNSNSLLGTDSNGESIRDLHDFNVGANLGLKISDNISLNMNAMYVAPASDESTRAINNIKINSSERDVVYVFQLSIKN